MDPSVYDSKTIELIDLCMERRKNYDRRIISSLKRLCKIGREKNDPALLGFAYYHLADACYSMELSYNSFLNYLSKSLNYMIKAGDDTMIPSACNFFGIDAANNGSYDVAYHYYAMAMRIAEENEDDNMRGVISANLAHLHECLGNLRHARQLYLKSNRLARGHSENIYYYHNLINSEYAIGFISLRLGDVKSAQRAEKRIRKLEKEAGETRMYGMEMLIHFLRVELALTTGEDASFQTLMNDLIRYMGEKYLEFDIMDDILNFCKFLLDYNKTVQVLRILDLIRDKVERSDVVQIKKAYKEIEIAYYEKTGEQKKLSQSLHEHFHLALTQQTERNRIYLSSIGMINLIDNLRSERAQMRQENKLLQLQAQMDPLTGIPNRLAMNMMLEAAYERAYADKTSFCVAIIDIDSFKDYNDTYGHMEGDFCLKRVAHELQAMSNHPSIQCARYGGDEFVMIYENMADDEILKYANALDRKIRSLDIHFSASRIASVVTVSQGLCNSVPLTKSKLWDYMTEADVALYSVKNQPKDMKNRQSVILCHIPKTFGSKSNEQ